MGASSTSYSVLVDRLSSKLQNHGLGDKTPEEVYEIFTDYIKPAIAYFYACKKDLSDRDDYLQVFRVELDNQEIEILCNFMLIEWLGANFINVPILLKQSLPTKDVQVFSKKNHLDGLENLKNGYERKTRQLISAYSNIDSGLFDVIKSTKNNI